MTSLPSAGVLGAPDGTLTCTAPDDMFLCLGFHDDRGTLFDGETVSPGETRVITPRGRSWSVTYRTPDPETANA